MARRKRKKRRSRDQDESRGSIRERVRRRNRMRGSGIRGINFFEKPDIGESKEIVALIDTERVNDDDEELDLYEKMVHWIGPQGRGKPMDCSGDPEDCEECEAGETPKAQIYFKLYDIEKEEIVAWNVSDATMENFTDIDEDHALHESVLRVKRLRNRYQVTFIDDTEDFFDEDDPYWDIMDEDEDGHVDKPMREYAEDGD